MGWVASLEKRQEAANAVPLSETWQKELASAQSAADNNIAIAKAVEKDGSKSYGLLERAMLIDRQSQNALPESFQAQRLERDRTRLLKESGVNTAALTSKSLYTGNSSERAQLRQLRKRRGAY